MNAKEIIQSLTIEEKAKLLTGGDGMCTATLEKYGIVAKNMADGPHGARLTPEDNCTHFPNLCSLAATWDVERAHLMGEALAYDCIEHDVDMLLAPGINIKRTPLCGRNFEYLSEDPILAGELGAAYINGLQKHGVAASLKHFAANNQEKYRQEASVEVDERTLREIYLRGFEIAVKKSNPQSVMCAYNKINAVWCAENPLLLSEILKDEWGYEGFVISDWGAVQNTAKSIKAGLDFHMPANEIIEQEIKDALAKGEITEAHLDRALERVLGFLLKDKPVKTKEYNRDSQHTIAKDIAADGVVLLKNDNNMLPLTSKKHKKIAVIGEFAKNPLISGQGSAEVHQSGDYTDSPLAELEKLLPDTEFIYKEIYKKCEFSENMLWIPLYSKEYNELMASVDAVLVFAGSMQSEDTEKLDRRSASINPNHDMVIDMTSDYNKNMIVVLQTGSAVVLDGWHKKVPAIAEMWLAGEGAGKAIAEVLCGKVNPSGKLPETFPTKLRTDMDYPGDGFKVEYNEKLDVGYRYYDKHPEEILYPFGHGLSYTSFEYSDIKVSQYNDGCKVSFKLKNTGDCDGAEVAQLYISDVVSTVVKPVKELKKFKKMFLKKGEETEVVFDLEKADFEYYNTSLHQWVAENGLYKILIGASSRDIRLEGNVVVDGDMPYTIAKVSEDMIG